ncbi:MAG TPA: hypothetical protein DCQ92_06965, partial [Verrucomicrobia subdivision 3 bacterium]|nr:hypothetical protein [Limisphaerales bacterium]
MNSFKAIGCAQVKARRAKAKAEIYCGSRAGRAATARFYGDARSLKNKILFVDNFRVIQLNRLVPRKFMALA